MVGVEFEVRADGVDHEFSPPFHPDPKLVRQEEISELLSVRFECDGLGESQVNRANGDGSNFSGFGFGYGDTARGVDQSAGDGIERVIRYAVECFG